MVGSGAAAVAEVAGVRLLITMDKGHKLEIRPPGGPAVVVESRPVTEFSAAVDSQGRLHMAAWLLSRHLMYYTSADGIVFTRSTLLKSDGGLRLKDCLVFADSGVSVAYVAETEFANTLVCYRYEGGEWEGRRIVEVELPQRLTAWQFDGSPAGVSILYSVKEAGRTVVLSRPVTGDGAAEPVATVNGGITDFCVLTSGGVRQACWLAEGHLMANGMRLTDEPWSREWPHLKRGENGVQCLWLANGLLHGTQLGAQRSALRPVALREPLPCMLAVPGELRKAVVEAHTLKEPSLLPEAAERVAGKAAQQYPSGRDYPQGGSGDITLTDVVRNQAIYLTRMQESLSAMERSVLRMQSELNRLTKEVSMLMRAREERAKPEPLVRAASLRIPSGQEVQVVMVDVPQADADAGELVAPPEPVESPDGQSVPAETIACDEHAGELGGGEEEDTTYGGA